ncbi:YceD family protein [Effusibacillus consociatus]|uniref:YceD family protein n=1 Tax=Effusibacillus consociatus TaxID=1117041 RepID=A0ABV9PX32_9BACL
MILRWREVHEQPKGIHLRETIELPNLVKENRQVIALGPIEMDLHAQVVSDTLTVNGKLSGPVTYRCSRCLTDFKDELSTSFTEQFVRADADQLSEEDERNPVAGDAIELDPYLEQEILLAMPYTPVCKESCAGLCPECGINRNEHVCECKTERIDPRLADLAKLLKSE